MPDNIKRKDTFNYYQVCLSCTDEECCSDPYFTFCARNELDKIEEKIKGFPKKFHYFLDINTLLYKKEEYQYYGIRKIRGKCIFLKDLRSCLIHNVKPLHCRCWPLIWNYEATENKLIIYMDDCPLTPILSKNKQWIEDMKQTIISEVLEMSKLDRIAISSLECEDTMQKIDIIDLSQFE